MSLESAAEFAGVQRPRACLPPRCGLFRKDDDSPVRWNGVGQSCFLALRGRDLDPRLDDYRFAGFGSSGRGRRNWRRSRVSSGGRKLRRRRGGRPQS